MFLKLSVAKAAIASGVIALGATEVVPTTDFHFANTAPAAIERSEASYADIEAASLYEKGASLVATAPTEAEFIKGAELLRKSAEMGNDSANQAIAELVKLGLLNQDGTSTASGPDNLVYAGGANQALVDEGSEAMTAFVGALPGVIASKTAMVAKHGAKAFYYDDPEVKKQEEEMVGFLSKGLRALGQAISEDMAVAAATSAANNAARTKVIVNTAKQGRGAIHG